LFPLVIVAIVTASAVDPRAAERDPDHGHIVVGGSALDRARALAWHIRYGHEESLTARVPAAAHEGDEKDGVEVGGTHVLSIGTGAAAVSVLDSSGSMILTTGWSFTPPATVRGRAARPSSVHVIESDQSVAEPPPRAS
jgi:hypothetical protein